MKTHVCSICKTVGEWDANWSWFGSDADEESGRPILKFCSDRCAKKAGKHASSLEFKGFGELRVTYEISCGRCGDVSPIDAHDRRTAERAAVDDGHVQHPGAGWLCHKCALSVGIWEAAAKDKDHPPAAPAVQGDGR